jgi:eukaryotic-like serine/threonine-protein kinase
MKRNSVFLLIAFVGLSPPHVACDDQPQVLADLLMEADEKQFAVIFLKFKELGERGLPFLTSEIERRLSPDAKDDTKEELAKRQANAAVALLLMNKSEKVWPLLKHSPDPRVRSYLIERFGPDGVNSKVLTARLAEEMEVSVRRAILLSLGEFGLDRLSQDQRLNLRPRLLEIYRDDPDPGIHGAAEWLLRQWQASDKMKELDKQLVTGKVEGKREWYLNRQGQTMTIIIGPVEFSMGESGERHRRRIERSFSIASKEVTVGQFLRFLKERKYFKDIAPTLDCPVNEVTWYEAVAYCNWLSEQEGIPKEQWCYEPNKNGNYVRGMTMSKDYLKRTGYRLPTEAEWEYACGVGAETGFCFGESEDLVAKYAWCARSTQRPYTTHPVGSLKPNDLGLFDMHGNGWEWCQNIYRDYPKTKDNSAIPDLEENTAVTTKTRVLHGGSFDHVPRNAHSAGRRNSYPWNSSYGDGFRPARTVTP